MTKRLVLAAILSLSLAACGGDDGGSSKGDSNPQTSPAGTAGMAGAFITEITKIKDCMEGQVDGKGACGVSFLQDPVTGLCSDVRTGKANAQFPGADYSKFTKTCEDWASVLGLDAAGKVTLLAKMAADLEPLK